MTEHVDDLLPFYTNHTLSAAQAAQVEQHLLSCSTCRRRWVEWQALSEALNVGVSRRLSAGVSHPAEQWSIPPLSPLVAAGAPRRPSLQEAVLSAVQLIWAQRLILAHEWVLLLLAGFTALGFVVSFVLGSVKLDLVLFPLVAVIPIAALLIASMLNTAEEDPAYEIVAAAPTSPGTLVLARQTLALGALSLLAFAGSLLLALLGQPAPSLFNLIAAWLGPMLLLSALSTALSLKLPPQAAAGAMLLLWGTLLILLIYERAGAPLLEISLLWMLNPGWLLLLIQVLLAGLLWSVSWVWLAGKGPGAQLPVGG